MQSSTVYEYPMICVREILANAVCHRNYEDHERLTYVTVYSDRIEVKSPGDWTAFSLPEGKPVALSQLMGESVQRNMTLAHAISSVGMAEVEGSGIPTAIDDCRSCSAPEPSVEQRNGYVVVTIYPSEDWDLSVEYAIETQQDQQDARLQLQEAQKEVEHLKTELRRESRFLEEELQLKQDPMVGESEAMKRVFKQIAQVAPTEATVLITGETGTGKELAARAIHHSSPRRGRPLVVVNCAALSESLIESELFGHEKGAFTGATGRKIGRFELAHEGTIFLDEISELSLSLQSKLLRVLQEREFERVGGTRTVKADVRVIVATNRELEAEVRQGLFRSDLWYRLNVFPIRMPPLRERKEDIPLLAAYFGQKFSILVGKDFQRFTPETLQTMADYSWPGNVRELANVIERAMLIGSTSNVADQLRMSLRNREPLREAMQKAERDYILSALMDTDWQIEGQNGAAAILQLAPKSLRHRMKKLGIANRKSVNEVRG